MCQANSHTVSTRPEILRHALPRMLTTVVCHVLYESSRPLASGLLATSRHIYCAVHGRQHASPTGNEPIIKRYDPRRSLNNWFPLHNVTHGYMIRM